MKIGIISGCQGEKKSFFAFFKNRRIKEYLFNSFKVNQIILRGKVSEKKIQKAEKRLNEAGCSFVIKEKYLKNETQLKDIKVLENKVFFESAFELYKEYVRLLELKAYKMKVLIIDKNLSAVNGEFLKRLCFYSSKCDILTEEVRRAEEIADYIFKHNGFFVSAKETVSQSSYDAVFDLDNKHLKMAGRVFINKLNLGLDEFSQFDINMFELLYMLEKEGFKNSYVKTVGSTAYFEIK